MQQKWSPSKSVLLCGIMDSECESRSKVSLCHVKCIKCIKCLRKVRMEWSRENRWVKEGGKWHFDFFQLSLILLRRTLPRDLLFYVHSLSFSRIPFLTQSEIYCCIFTLSLSLGYPSSHNPTVDPFSSLPSLAHLPFSPIFSLFFPIGN